jgi:hypothetical protein
MTVTTEINNSVFDNKPNLVGSNIDINIAIYIDRLEREVRNLMEIVNDQKIRVESIQRQYDTARNNHADDISAISTALMQEAEERDWCSVYDNFVSDLNSRLHVELATRVCDYNVELVVQVKFTGNFEASNADDAIDAARDSFTAYSYGGAELSVDDYDFIETNAEVA